VADRLELICQKAWVQYEASSVLVYILCLIPFVFDETVGSDRHRGMVVTCRS
jgi:hypothetical protein